MFCSKCGTAVADGAGFCSACGQPIASTGIAPAAYANVAARPTVAYAGFWLRFVALIIDGIVLGTVGWIVTLPFMASFGLRDILRGHPPTRPEDFFPFFGLFLRLAMIRLALNWLYYAFMESSSWQATLGKKALGLEVTDLEGRRVSFGRASGRFFGKILSTCILGIGYIMAGFTEKKQALHDMLAGCLVIRKL
jgi:uncharacterized RDD family membrane protein YckC